MIFQLKSKSSKLIFSMVAIITVAVVWFNVWRMTGWLGLKGGTVLTSFVKDAVDAAFIVAFLSFLFKPKEILSFLGLNGSIIQGFGIAFLCVIPLYIVFPLIGSLNSDTTLSLLTRKSLLPGFIEELICRAFMFGLLFRYAKVGFFWAVMLPAIIFGMGHVYQGHDLMSSLAAFGVTFFGAIYFNWMYAEWDFNLWLPIGLHVLMNAAWVLFDAEGTEVAAGGLISNMVRVASILLAIALTIHHKKKNKARIFQYPVWSF